MNKLYKIEITFKNKDQKPLVMEGVAGFDVMQQGWFYIQTKDEFEDQGPEKNDKKVVVKWERYWFPKEAVLKIKMNEKVTFEGELEVAKYRKFKDLGIDMAHTPISHTEPPDPAKVAKKVSEDKFVQILEAKERRKKNAN